MQIKDTLRKNLKAKRGQIADKDKKDELILQNLLSADVFKNCKTLLCFASTGSEINTDPIITAALSHGKVVALPVCSDKKGIMDFYKIKSLSDLKVGAYGIREPDVKICEKVCDFDNSLIIVPALTFTPKGYRLGYGGGYYDRFLQDYTGVSLGICYDEMLMDEIPTDKYDLPVEIIVTDKIS